MAKFDLEKFLSKAQEQKLGQLGKETAAKIVAKLDLADKLERQRGLSAREALENVRQADQLRAEARNLREWMNSSEFTMMAEARNRTNDIEALNVFSRMQSAAMEQDAMREAEVEQILASSTNFLIGTDPRDLKRQINRLLEGEGEIDAETGGRYVRFKLPNSGASNRAVMLPTGEVGFVVESRSNLGE
ncbi:MAG: hypothetical protein LCI00_02180 [Chloroflexi bacterium]|nr:hypothetical protein [Chloroflexota bacterium]